MKPCQPRPQARKGQNQKKIKKIHFIGIGGIGVSALAQYYLEKGCKVSGSDLSSSEITENLKNLGAEISIGAHASECLKPEVKQVIYSPAVQPDNPELKKAYKLQAANYKLQVMSYPEALGELTKKYFTIAVSGIHGKSTTTAMIALTLIKAGLDPTVIVGTKLKEFGGSNCRVGESKYLVIEADEHFASFLRYFPKIIVLTNIEKDHLDYYKNLKNILKTFKEYIGRLPENGVLVANRNDINISNIKNQIKNQKFKIIDYSIKQREFTKLKKILKVPGEHNVSNALAALAVARVLKIPDKISFKALSGYKGSWRRFEITEILDPKPYTLISDYAHHPTEIKTTLEAAREKWPDKKIWTIFQPHQYQRTYYLFDDFVKAFDIADEIIITKIYDVAGREEKQISKKVNAKKLAGAIKERGKNVYFIADFKKIPEFLKDKIKPDDIILIMGAGDIYKLVDLVRSLYEFSTADN